MSASKPKVDRSVVKKITTTVTLDEAQYEPILRKAVGAPDDAEVRIPHSYGGGITIIWTTTEYSENGE